MFTIIIINIALFDYPSIASKDQRCSSYPPFLMNFVVLIMSLAKKMPLVTREKRTGKIACSWHDVLSWIIINLLCLNDSVEVFLGWFEQVTRRPRVQPRRKETELQETTDDKSCAVDRSAEC